MNAYLEIQMKHIFLFKKQNRISGQKINQKFFIAIIDDGELDIKEKFSMKWTCTEKSYRLAMTKYRYTVYGNSLTTFPI